MEKDRVWVITGYSRHFTGDVEKEIIGLRWDRKDAEKRGHQWSQMKNEQYKEEGKNIHAFYRMDYLAIY